ncbi:nucleoside triphosphate pyrophosphohydrolase [Pullulanibacillus sp. KACC 23026]|uniref:nucleoside triphosphate pyrophosphohydrolase n=1 Tax=Pullulanibacillus sp. KACC 23026 TaxID=3028315 RepID=UPI0023B13FAA|nr:nucleoside triphosphate pyrophosphohydrolase [Pullulanibacillus sp. KACC 23026]WEG12725.1 nucleoside triphosphate pyrophosphohydrolase [Pullulanibacillus sp. KACC 23026]
MSGRITVVGLGSGEIDQLSLGIYKLLKKAKALYIRTEDHPIVQDLREEGFAFFTFDEVYIQHDTFEKVYEEIVDRLIHAANETDIVYAVPGHPMVAEKTVQLLLEKGPEVGIEVDVAGGQSFLDPLFTALQIDPIEGLQFVDALSLDADLLAFHNHLVICQIYDGYVASEVKLTLLEQYPPDYEVTLVQAAGDQDQIIKKVALSELDYDWTLDNRTSLYVPPIENAQLTNHSFPRLRKIIQTLRSPEGCPWDREQTHESLKKYLIEEVYEVIEAIDEQDDEHLAEELGDVLLQVMLHAQIGEDEGYFNIYDVIKALSDKMIRRHPHVFGDVNVQSSNEVVVNWEAIKAKEKDEQDPAVSLLEKVGKGLPPLMQATELQKEAAKVGFDWPEIEEVWAKIYEELEECREEEQSGDRKKLESEIGDVLFSIVNLARKHRIDPSIALLSTILKFKKRFENIEEAARDEGRDLMELTLEEMDKIWIQAKENLK